MKFCFNGGGFHELTETLKKEKHTVLQRVPSWTNYTSNDKTRFKYNKLLKNYVLKNKPDVYICTKGYRDGCVVYPETTEWIQKNVGITVFWSQDDPFFTPTFMNNALHRGYALALSCSTGSFPEYKRVKIKPYLFWPAWDTLAFKNIKPVLEADKVDIVFVGTPYACTNVPRKDLLLWAVNEGLKIEIYGSKQWVDNKAIRKRSGELFIQGDSRLAPYYKGVWKDWINIPNLFQRARINISNHVVKAPMYLNDRTFLVMGPGGCLVMDHNPGIEKVFTHNKEVVFYENMQTFKHRTLYYLKHEYSRKRIYENSRKKILEAHTYRHRAFQLLKILKENGLK